MLCTGNSIAPDSNGTMQGVPDLREALYLQQQLGRDPEALADCAQALGNALEDANIDLEEAESLTRQSLALRSQIFTPNHPKHAAGLFLLGQVLLKRRALPEAET